MKWSEQTIPERVATVQRKYKRMAYRLYPFGVPKLVDKTEERKHDLYYDHIMFADELGRILEKK